MYCRFKSPNFSKWGTVPISHNIAGVNDNEIIDVKEHKMTIKVVTMKNGTVLLDFQEFKYGDVVYTLQPSKADNPSTEQTGIGNSDLMNLYKNLMQLCCFSFIGTENTSDYCIEEVVVDYELIDYVADEVA